MAVGGRSSDAMSLSSCATQGVPAPKHTSLCQSPSMSELPPSEDSPPNKRQRKRLTFSAITGALGDIAADVCSPAAVTPEQPKALHSSEFTALRPRQRRLALTPMTGAVVGAALCENTPPTQFPDDRGTAQEILQPGLPLRAGNVTVRRRVGRFLHSEHTRSPSPLRNPLNQIAQPTRLSGQKRSRADRDSIGATARVEAMVATATQTLGGQQGSGATDGGSSTDEEDQTSFAHRVRQANSFRIGLQAAEASRSSADELLSPGGSALVEPDSHRIQEGIGAPAFSRSAFRSGLRASAIVAKVEAEMRESTSGGGSRPGTPGTKPPGSSSALSAVASPSGLKSPMAPSPSGLKSPGTIAKMEQAALDRAKMLHAQKIVSSLFST